MRQLRVGRRERTLGVNPARLAEIQRGYAQAIRSGDVEGSAAMFAPEGVIWHNFDDAARSARGSNGLAVLHGRMPDVDWVDVAVRLFESGFVWQAIITGTAPNGPVRAHTCMVFTVSEAGLIERLDEYLDPSGLAALSAQL